MDFAASQSAFATAVLNADRPVPEGITTFGGDADPARFAIYRNNVFVGLTRALAQRFPVTEKLVGPEFFLMMARAYAQDHKPASPLIINYGDNFPDFIANFAPAAGIVYLSDVAQIEAAWTRAYHAADAPTLALATLAAIDPETLADLRLSPHPSAHLIPSDHPSGSIWSAHQQELVLPVTDWRPQAVLVVRPEMTVDIHVLPPQDAVFAGLLFRGAPLGEAAETALTANHAFDFGAALIGLTGLGTFATLQQDQGKIQ